MNALVNGSSRIVFPVQACQYDDTTVYRDVKMTVSRRPRLCSVSKKAIPRLGFGGVIRFGSQPLTACCVALDAAD